MEGNVRQKDPVEVVFVTDGAFGINRAISEGASVETAEPVVDVRSPQSG